jgi:hypothetical protein
MGKLGKGEWCRWHRYNSEGVKEQRCFPRGENPSSETGYTPWTRGTGAPTDAALVNMRISMRRTHLGVPKSPEQREKMRQAKLGVPKTAEHRRNMSQAQLRRAARKKGREYADTANNTEW